MKKMKKKIFNFSFVYQKELKEELKNNSIVLSFAISIFFVGIFSIFYSTNNTLLIGIAISSLLLTIIQCFSNGNTLLNILPVFTLLIFGFFQKSIENIPIISSLLKSNYSNFIIFLSLSLTFLTQAYKNILYKHKLSELELKYNDEKNKMINDQLLIIKNIKDRVDVIRKVSDESNFVNDTYVKAVDDLLNYVDDESFLSNVKSTLITKGSEEKKVTFNIEEIEESIILNNKMIRNREINAIKETDEIM